jgi:hypothetical protein
MIYVKLIDGQIVKIASVKPESDRRLDTGEWVLGYVGPECGWYYADTQPRPVETTTLTYDRSLQLIDGVPTIVWIEREKTLAEKAVRYPSSEESAKLAARLIVIPKLEAAELTDEQVEQFTGLFPDWEEAIGTQVEAGWVYRWDGTLVQCIQGHMVQSDWTPDVAVSLWTIHRQAGTISEWVQPPAENPYMIGDRVTFNGSTYESVIDNNIWSPNGYPAGWKLV